MRGLSTTIIVILTLMIGIALVSLGYVFFLGTMEETTEVGEAVVEKTTQLLTTKYKIESLEQGTPGHIYIRNMGSNDVTGISVYINGVLDTTAEIPPSIIPNQVGTINVTAGLNPGDEVRLTGAQGSIVIGTVPGGAPPPPPCTSDGSACTTGNQCCNGICEAGICVTLCGPCGAACSEGGYSYNDGTHACDGSVDDACNALNGIWDTCTQTGDSSDADCDGNCQSGLSYCTTGSGNPPFYWGRCVDLQNDDCSCGTCGNVCLGGTTCQSGICAGGPPVGFWKFDENVGTTASDSSTYNNDGTIYSGTSMCSNPPTANCPLWVGGVENSGLLFDGSNDHIRVPTDPSLDITDEITIAAWVKPDTTSGYRRIVSKQYQTDTTTGNSCFQLGINTDNRWRWSIVTNVSYYNRLADAAYNPQIGQWYHFVGTYNGTHMVMYLDGQPISTTAASGIIRVNSSEILTIANSYFNGSRGYHFPGSIDEVKIWDSSLSSTEVLNEYNSYSPPGPDTSWGQPTSFSSSGRSNHTTVRCMGGQAPNLPNIKIKSLHIRFNNTGTGAMAVYFGGSEGNTTSPTVAAKQSEVINQPVSAGWNTFYLPSEINWPANQITWVCWKRSGAGYVYYNFTSSFTTDFFTSHGRHDDGGGNPTLSFTNNLGTFNNDTYWYEVYLTYYQT